MRLLDASDEPAFQALLRAVYGDTYSYRSFYEPGGVAALIQSGRASLWGDFSATGELLSHTAFLHKDPRGDYLESGLSFRGAGAAKGTPDAVVWEHLFAWLHDRCVLVHQNTTTWHPLAQRYAERYMRARPTGMIVDYAIDERLVGIPHPDTPMQALTMTSVVRPDRLPSPSRRRFVPHGPWGDWLSAILVSFGIAVIERTSASTSDDLGLEDLETNAALGLRRRVVVRGAAAPLVGAEAYFRTDSLVGVETHMRTGSLMGPDAHMRTDSLLTAAASPRTDLVHLPCDERMAAFPELERAGYVPVGIRPHATREDEVVLQRLPGARRREAMEALAAASLIPRARPLVEGWRTTCAQTS